MDLAIAAIKINFGHTWPTSIQGSFVSATRQSDPLTLAQDVDDEPAPPAPAQRQPADLVEHSGPASSQVSGNRLTLVGLRKAHQTRYAARALRRVPVPQPLSLTSGAGVPGGANTPSRTDRTTSVEPEPSLRQRLLKNLVILGHNGVVFAGTTSGAARLVRQTGSYAPVAVNTASGTTGRDQNKAVAQAVTAEVCCLSSVVSLLLMNTGL